MKTILILAFSVCLVSCSSQQKRTKYSDKSMRVMIDPKSSARNDYIKVQTALVQSNLFTVVDRSSGFHAVQREQNRTYYGQPDRYANNQKFSHWGKLYGIGAVIVAKSQCRTARSYWKGRVVRVCQLFLNMVDSNTGEVVVGVRDEIEAERGATPDWESVVEKLAEAYPKYFTKEAIDERMKNYMKESEKVYKEKVVKVTSKYRGYKRNSYMNINYGTKKPAVKYEVSHDDNFDKNGKALPADEVLRRAGIKNLEKAGVAK